MAALFEGRRRGSVLLTLLVNGDLAHEALLVTSGFLNERCAAYRVDPRNFSRCARARAGPTAVQKLRIVALGISGGRSLTGPLRDARRFPSTRLQPVPELRRCGLGFCPSFKGHFLSRRAKP
jgi:hypothetical protein